MLTDKCWICEKNAFRAVGKKKYCRKHFYEVLNKSEMINLTQKIINRP
jgi:hypothetical protein